MENYTTHSILFASYIIVFSSFIVGIIFFLRRIYIMNIDNWVKDEGQKIMSKLIKSLRPNNSNNIDNDYINPKILAKVLNDALLMFDDFNTKPLLDFAIANNVELGIKKLAKSGKEVERINAARIIFHFPKMFYILEDLAKKDESIIIRARALITLSQLGHSYDFELLAKWLNIYKSEAHILMHNLFLHKALFSDDNLFQIIFDDKTYSQTKSYAFKALAKRNDGMVQEAVNKVFCDMINNDILVINALDNNQDIEILLNNFDELIASQNWEIRNAAARNAEKLYAFEILEKLQKWLDSDWRVNKTRISAISKIEDIIKYSNPEKARKIRLYSNQQIVGLSSGVSA